MTSTTLRSLASDLRTSTTEAHSDAENAGFMGALVGGTLPVAALADYTAQLQRVYTALEKAVRTVAARDSRLTSLADPRLERHAAIAADLTAMTGVNWRSELPEGAATRAYVAHLEELAAAGDAARLVAHHYVRYLGDMSGGQIIARKMHQAYGLGAEATTFYDFSAVGKIKPYRDGYRERLDRLDLSDREYRAAVNEASLAFALNHAVFAELGERHLVQSARP